MSIVGPVEKEAAKQKNRWRRIQEQMISTEVGPFRRVSRNMNTRMMFKAYRKYLHILSVKQESMLGPFLAAPFSSKQALILMEVAWKEPAMAIRKGETNIADVRIHFGLLKVASTDIAVEPSYHCRLVKLVLKLILSSDIKAIHLVISTTAPRGATFV